MLLCMSLFSSCVSFCSSRDVIDEPLADVDFDTDVGVGRLEGADQRGDQRGSRWAS